MSSSFQKTSSKIFLVIFIGFIAISFMFTGIQSFNGATKPDAVAEIGGYSVDAAEFDRVFKSYYGGRFTPKQIEQFNLKNNVIKTLIDQKTLLVFSDEIGIEIAPIAIKKQIKQLPYFQTNGAFDVNKYKSLLNYNRLTPQKFETSISEELQTNSVRSLLQNVPFSNTQQKLVKSLQDQKREATFTTINEAQLEPFIKVNKKEISSFLKNADNLKRAEATFKSRKSTLDQKEEVRARHILLATKDKDAANVLKKITKIRKEVTTGNFSSLAKKYTEDPSGKQNGGDLKWFAKGRMVPAFEKVAFSQKAGTISSPVKTQFGYHIIYTIKKKAAKEAKFDTHKKEIAKELIQDTKTDEVHKMAMSISKEIESAFKNNQLSKARKITAKYNLTLSEKVMVNGFDGIKEIQNLDPSNVRSLFKKKSSVFKTELKNGKISIISTKTPSKKKDDKKLEDGFFLSEKLAKDLGSNIIKLLQEDNPPKIYTALLKQL